MEATPRRRALLVGNPNVGKSVLFGALTGTYVTVSNYPGTTVEVTRGRVALDGVPHWELLDTPGTNNLVPMSEDEAVTRDILLSEPSDLIVQVGDAKNLARTLLLTLQLAELGVPFLLDLNMADEARSRGIAIDLAGLTRELGGVRVNASAAISGEGVEPVRAYLVERTHAEVSVGRAPLPCAARFPDDVESAIAEVEAALPELSVATRGVATMLLAGDRGFGGWLEANVDASARKRAGELAEKLMATHGVPTFALLSKLRLARAQAIVRVVQRKADGAVGARAHEGRVPWGRAVAVAGVRGASSPAATYQGALALASRRAQADRSARRLRVLRHRRAPLLARASSPAGPRLATRLPRAVAAPSARSSCIAMRRRGRPRGSSSPRSPSGTRRTGSPPSFRGSRSTRTARGR